MSRMVLTTKKKKNLNLHQTLSYQLSTPWSECCTGHRHLFAVHILGDHQVSHLEGFWWILPLYQTQCCSFWNHSSCVSWFSGLENNKLEASWLKCSILFLMASFHTGVGGKGCTGCHPMHLCLHIVVLTLMISLCTPEHPLQQQHFPPLLPAC